MRRLIHHLSWIRNASLLLCIGTSDAQSQDYPADIIGVLDHAAIVVEMMNACSHARPDLSERLRTAEDAWWDRNGYVRDALANLRQEANTSSRSRALFQYYEATKQKLENDVGGPHGTNNSAFAANCDDVLKKIIDGGLDFPLPEKNE